MLTNILGHFICPPALVYQSQLESITLKDVKAKHRSYTAKRLLTMHLVSSVLLVWNTGSFRRKWYTHFSWSNVNVMQLWVHYMPCNIYIYLVFHRKELSSTMCGTQNCKDYHAIHPHFDCHASLIWFTLNFWLETYSYAHRSRQLLVLTLIS